MAVQTKRKLVPYLGIYVNVKPAEEKPIRLQLLVYKKKNNATVISVDESYGLNIKFFLSVM